MMTYYKSVDTPKVVYRLDDTRGWYANDSQGWQQDTLGTLFYSVKVDGEGEPIDVAEALQVLEDLGAAPDDLDA